MPPLHSNLVGSLAVCPSVWSGMEYHRCHPSHWSDAVSLSPPTRLERPLRHHHRLLSDGGAGSRRLGRHLPALETLRLLLRRIATLLARPIRTRRRSRGTTDAAQK